VLFAKRFYKRAQQHGEFNKILTIFVHLRVAGGIDCDAISQHHFVIEAFLLHCRKKYLEFLSRRECNGWGF
jgi:hypothetical protein